MAEGDSSLMGLRGFLGSTAIVPRRGGAPGRPGCKVSFFIVEKSARKGGTLGKTRFGSAPPIAKEETWRIGSYA